jgi:hypothetical protein
VGCLIVAQDQYSCIQDALTALPGKPLTLQCFCYYFQELKYLSNFLTLTVIRRSLIIEQKIKEVLKNEEEYLKRRKPINSISLFINPRQKICT